MLLCPMGLEFRTLKTVVLHGWYLCLGNLEEVPQRDRTRSLRRSHWPTDASASEWMLWGCEILAVWKNCKLESAVASGINCFFSKRCCWGAADLNWKQTRKWMSLFLAPAFQAPFSNLLSVEPNRKLERTAVFPTPREVAATWFPRGNQEKSPRQ